MFNLQENGTHYSNQIEFQPIAGKIKELQIVQLVDKGLISSAPDRATWTLYFTFEGPKEEKEEIAKLNKQAQTVLRRVPCFFMPIVRQHFTLPEWLRNAIP